MTELDEIWSKMLTEALENAKSTGRQDVADYLTLKATNDAIRQTGVRWLFDSLIEIAGHANRNNSSLSIEKQDPHSFAYRGSNMVGSLVRIRHGVRCLTAEAGWTRTPADGFMRGGALAFAKINHLGMSKSNAELLLTLSNDLPVWTAIQEEKAAGQFKSENLRAHFRILLAE